VFGVEKVFQKVKQEKIVAGFLAILFFKVYN
jgi:hypothetical protein